MKRFALILTIVLVGSLTLPLGAFAAEKTQGQIIQHKATGSLVNLDQDTLFSQLISQEVTYRLDDDSTLKLSCNFSGIPEPVLNSQFDQYASASPDVQIELVVRF